MRRVPGTLAGAALVRAGALDLAPRGPATPRSAAAAEAAFPCVAQVAAPPRAPEGLRLARSLRDAVAEAP